jgi:hypothetical protein
MNFSPFFMPLPVGVWHVSFTVRTSIVHKITGYKLCKIIFLLSSTRMPWISIINLYMSIKPEKYKYAFYTFKIHVHIDLLTVFKHPLASTSCYDWFVWIPNNVLKWGDLSSGRLLTPWASMLKIQFRVSY